MNICILYNITNDSVKYYNWHDGFTEAIKILSFTFNIDMINSYDNKDINFDKYDIIFLKESFTGCIYNKYKYKFNKKNKLGLFISSSNIIPSDEQLKIYDILFYETKWYYDYAKLQRHSNAIHAFGIDVNIMKPINVEKKYDVIFVGNICSYKRPLKILELPGKKICLGFPTDKKIMEKLKANDVEMKEFVEYDKLSEYYNQSKLCYVPCALHGGGERAVLEARACNVSVKIENDNPKLKELCESKIYSSEYYADQIQKVLYKYIYNNIKNFEYQEILKYFKNLKLHVLEIGGMDGKTFDPLYQNISEKWNVTILEPIPYQFEKLVNNYKNKKNVNLINKALTYNTDKIEMFTIDPKSLINNKDIPMFANGISSLYNDRNSLGEEYWNGRGKIHIKNGITFNTIKNHIIKIQVNATTIDELKLPRVDILQSDTEGFDYHILKIVLNKYTPYVIMFEWNNLPNDELDEVKKLLINYEVTFYYQDALCILKPNFISPLNI